MPFPLWDLSCKRGEGNNKQKTMILTVSLDFPPAEKDVTSMYPNYHLFHCCSIATRLFNFFLNLLIIYLSLFSFPGSNLLHSLKYCILMQKYILRVCTLLPSHFMRQRYKIRSKELEYWICLNNSYIPYSF